MHRLVAEAFIPNHRKHSKVRHINGVPYDNSAVNLTWTTSKVSKLPVATVNYMRDSTSTDRALAFQFGVSHLDVREVRSLRGYGHRMKPADKVSFIQDTVVSVTPVGLMPTYSPTIADTHSHVTNGIVTHNTGRLSAKGPPFQIIPKKTFWAKRIRSCFVAPKGKVCMQLDYSQGELRVVACVANETSMLKAYEAGMDLHSLTGSQLAGVQYDEFLRWKVSDDEKKAALFEDIRSRAKAGNFGLLYGMGVEGFMAYAWASYGLKLTLNEATAIRAAFFKAYPRLLDYHGNQKKLVRLHEYVRSPLGRVAYLPTVRSSFQDVRAKAERKAVNSPIQSTLSDMMIWAIAEIDDAYPNDEIAVVGMTHDSFFAYVDADKVEMRAKQAAEIMQNLPFHKVGWTPQLSFPVDAEAGPDLASLKKLKLAA